MTNETRMILEDSYLIERGILVNFSKFKSDNAKEIKYVFDCPEYEELKTKYNLVKIAGKGDNFTKAKRLLLHFTPRMNHDPYYDNHVEANALALLEFCYDKPENGINCKNKSKILAECCLALGIPARRVFIMPFSPYDTDNHVVNEIYDDTREKWVMMDPTTGGMFVDENRTPLSLIEMREHFAKNQFITFLQGNSRTKDLKAYEEKNIYVNWYVCKNSFYYMIDQYQEFGENHQERLYFVPEGYSVAENKKMNCEYRIEALEGVSPELQEASKKNLELAKSMAEPVATDIRKMLTKPCLN